MLWNYTKPQAKKLVINPQTAWLYVPEDNTVYVQDSKKIFSSGQAIRFLAGIGHLKDEFKIEFAHPEQDKDGNYVLEMFPIKGPESIGGVRKLIVTVDKSKYTIIKCAFNDSLGNISVINFLDIKTNVGLADSLFNFKAPPGVDVQKID